jgi:hypothetical protein
MAGSNFEEEMQGGRLKLHGFGRSIRASSRVPSRSDRHSLVNGQLHNAGAPVNHQIERRKGGRKINPWQSMNGHYAEFR